MNFANEIVIYARLFFACAKEDEMSLISLGKKLLAVADAANVLSDVVKSATTLTDDSEQHKKAIKTLEDSEKEKNEVIEQHKIMNEKYSNVIAAADRLSTTIKSLQLLFVMNDDGQLTLDVSSLTEKMSEVFAAQREYDELKK